MMLLLLLLLLFLLQWIAIERIILIRVHVIHSTFPREFVHGMMIIVVNISDCTGKAARKPFR
jgi:hypothetical protein